MQMTETHMLHGSASGIPIVQGSFTQAYSIAGADADRAIIDEALRELSAPQPFIAREWVGLTNEDTKNIQRENAGSLNYIRATENKLKELNT
jgi:hypothetical protein